jgi:hypothetical protein
MCSRERQQVCHLHLVWWAVDASQGRYEILAGDRARFDALPPHSQDVVKHRSSTVTVSRPHVRGHAQRNVVSLLHALSSSRVDVFASAGRFSSVCCLALVVTFLLLSLPAPSATGRDLGQTRARRGIRWRHVALSETILTIVYPAQLSSRGTCVRTCVRACVTCSRVARSTTTREY